MLNEVMAKLDEAQEYCKSKCIDPKTRQPSPEAIALYNAEFSSIKSDIEQYKSCVDFNEIFNLLFGINVSLMVNPDSVPENLWSLFGCNNSFSTILDTPKEDFFSTLENPSFLKTLRKSTENASDVDHKRREEHRRFVGTGMSRQMYNNLIHPEQKVQIKSVPQEIKMRKIFYDTHLNEIITEYNVDMEIPIIPEGE